MIFYIFFKDKLTHPVMYKCGNSVGVPITSVVLLTSHVQFHRITGAFALGVGSETREVPSGSSAYRLQHKTVVAQDDAGTYVVVDFNTLQINCKLRCDNHPTAPTPIYTGTYDLLLFTIMLSSCVVYTSINWETGRRYCVIIVYLCTGCTSHVPQLLNTNNV